MSAEIIKLPRDGFVLGDHLCGKPGPESHQMCFLPSKREGEHSWDDWRGCRIRVEIHGREMTLPFGGFAY